SVWVELPRFAPAFRQAVQRVADGDLGILGVWRFPELLRQSHVDAGCSAARLEVLSQPGAKASMPHGFLDSPQMPSRTDGVEKSCLPGRSRSLMMVIRLFRGFVNIEGSHCVLPFKLKLAACCRFVFARLRSFLTTPSPLRKKPVPSLEG